MLEVTFGDRLLTGADCTCGWRGPPRVAWWALLLDATQHAAAAHPDEPVAVHGECASSRVAGPGATLVR